MVVVFEARRLKFKINAKDHNPPHVHVEGLGGCLRVNLLTLEPMDRETGFAPSTIKRIIELVELRRPDLLKLWREYHG